MFTTFLDRIYQSEIEFSTQTNQFHWNYLINLKLFANIVWWYNYQYDTINYHLYKHNAKIKFIWVSGSIFSRWRWKTIVVKLITQHLSTDETLSLIFYSIHWSETSKISKLWQKIVISICFGTNKNTQTGEQITAKTGIKIRAI